MYGQNTLLLKGIKLYNKLPDKLKTLNVRKEK